MGISSFFKSIGSGIRKGASYVGKGINTALDFARTAQKKLGDIGQFVGNTLDKIGNMSPVLKHIIDEVRQSSLYKSIGDVYNDFSRYLDEFGGTIGGVGDFLEGVSQYDPNQNLGRPGPPAVVTGPTGVKIIQPGDTGIENRGTGPLAPGRPPVKPPTTIISPPTRPPGSAIM